MNIVIEKKGYKVVDIINIVDIKQLNFFKDEFERVKSSFSDKDNVFQETAANKMLVDIKEKLKKIVGEQSVCDINITVDIKEVKKDTTIVVTLQALLLEEKSEEK